MIWHQHKLVDFEPEGMMSEEKMVFEDVPYVSQLDWEWGAVRTS